MPSSKEAFSVALDNGYRDSARQNLDFFSIDRPMWLRKIDSRPQLGALPNARAASRLESAPPSAHRVDQVLQGDAPPPPSPLCSSRCEKNE